MASAEGGAGLPAASAADNYEISDSESASSHVGSAVPASSCPYRSSRLYDGECTRYFDCPSHQLERSPEDDEAGPNSRPDQAEESQPDTEPEQPTPIDESRNTEVGTSPREDQLRDGLVLNVQDSESPVNDSTRNNGLHERQAPTRSREGSSSSSNSEPETGITLREALDETREPQGSPTTNDSVPQITHAAATPLNRDSVSSPIAPAFNPTTDRRSPLDFALPRWQPDAEVTYCPICGTQFGFFVRKHHCR